MRLATMSMLYLQRQTDESVCGCGYPIIRVDGAWEHVGVPNGVDTRHIPMPKRQS